MEIDQGLLSGWNAGRLLAFSGLDGPTDFYQCLVARAAFTETGLDVKLPGEAHLHFSDQLPLTAVLAGDFFWLNCAGGSSIRGVFLDTYHLLLEGACEITRLAPNLAALREGPRLLVGAKAHFAPALISADFDAARRARRAWLESVPLPAGLAPERAWLLAHALSQIKTMVYAPEGQIRRRYTTPDRWPHRGMWLWDSAFHAIGLRHIDVDLAREILEAVLDGQQPDGRLPLRTDPDFCDPEFTQPPVLCLAARLVDELRPDPAWIGHLYPRLAAYVRWDLAQRDSDGGGLVEWAIEGDVNCRSGESGMDNSPRFDAATRLDAVDFNAFLALECETLAGFARQIGREDEAITWEQARQGLAERINARLWDDQAGFYLDYDIEKGCHSTVLAASGFLPLIAGIPTPAQARRLAEHLANPATFGTPLPVASLAASHPDHAPDMWRGPVWVNLNWLIAFGFERYGMLKPAEMIRRKPVAEIEKFGLAYGTFFEFFDDRRQLDPPALMRKGKLAPQESPFHQVFFDYGWTATLYLDLIFTCLNI
jgi:glycogen debranching enzyme